MSRLATLEKICEKKNTLTNPSEVPSMSSATRGICPRRMSSAPRLFRFFVRVFGKNYRSYEVLEYLGHLWGLSVQGWGLGLQSLHLGFLKIRGLWRSGFLRAGAFFLKSFATQDVRRAAQKYEGKRDWNLAVLAGLSPLEDVPWEYGAICLASNI